MSVWTENPALFDAVRPWIVIEDYSRDGGHENPRHRIEVANDTPPHVRAILLALTAGCVACGARVHPFRERNGGSSRGGAASHVYYACACPLAERIGCSRGKSARDDYEDVIRRHRTPPASPGGLFR